MAEDHRNMVATIAIGALEAVSSANNLEPSSCHFCRAPTIHALVVELIESRASGVGYMPTCTSCLHQMYVALAREKEKGTLDG